MPITPSRMRPAHHVSQSSVKTGASVRLKMLISLIRMFSAGPLVSLKGSPMVSPTTQALCVSLFFPPKTFSFSMYFFALSQAPPAFDIITASMNPLAMDPARRPPRHFAPTRSPMVMGDRTASAPGNTISSTLAWVHREMQASLSQVTPGSPSRRPLISLNCLCTSTMMEPAAFRTLSMVSAPKRYGSMDPIITPERTKGSVRSSWALPVVDFTSTFSE
mmetsp:Transcript_1533/g.5256  ORF Transcript_1533/g.5256 Transcript_1533/m.5256 type:complete len:219 (+) Transcript_1533:4830-5486(+)